MEEPPADLQKGEMDLMEFTDFQGKVFGSDGWNLESLWERWNEIVKGTNWVRKRVRQFMKRIQSQEITEVFYPSIPRLAEVIRLSSTYA